MLPYHYKTQHTYQSVRDGSHVIDWNHQPDAFKVYPSSYRRFFLDKTLPTHRFFMFIGGLTAQKSYPGVTYALRTNPSAGALYPTEVYVQIKKVNGFQDGIYHLSPGEKALVLLVPLRHDEGVENFLHVRNINGFCFLFSALYYRSSWKYRDRAFRYCLHDTGHMLGTLEASCYLHDKTYHIRYVFDKSKLNSFFGFGQEEFFLSAAIVGVEEDDDATLPATKIETIDGTHFFEENILIEQSYAKTQFIVAHRQTKNPKFNVTQELFLETLWKRRSARAFDSARNMTQEIFHRIMAFIMEPIPSDCDCKVEIYAVIHRIESMYRGLWKEGIYIKTGDFRSQTGYLCLEQALGSEGAVTFFLVGNEDVNYQALIQKAGIIGHRLYLIANYLGVGCSGIGAYYDGEVATFLETEGMILYALAIGFALTP